MNLTIDHIRRKYDWGEIDTPVISHPQSQENGNYEVAYGESGKAGKGHGEV